jgi:hypothetical protein
MFHVPVPKEMRSASTPDELSDAHALRDQEKEVGVDDDR